MAARGPAAWNPWKMTAIGLAVVMMTALLTGLVVASLSRPGPEPRMTAERLKPALAPARVAAGRPAAPASSAACKRYPASHAPRRDTIGAPGNPAGAARNGPGESRRHDAPRGAASARCAGARGHTT